VIELELVGDEILGVQQGVESAGCCASGWRWRRAAARAGSCTALPESTHGRRWELCIILIGSLKEKKMKERKRKRKLVLYRLSRRGVLGVCIVVEFCGYTSSYRGFVRKEKERVSEQGREGVGFLLTGLRER
jgi:hypothetical protein